MSNFQNKWFFIVNPAARNGKAARRWLFFRQALTQARIPHEVAITDHQHHATECVRAAIHKGFRQIVAVGGDGTNHEVVNGILQQTTVPTHQIRYALLPSGTGNDWAHQHQIPTQKNMWINMLKTCKTALHDVGKTCYQLNGKSNECYFVNIAGMAYDGYVVKALAEHQDKGLHKAKFLYLALKCLFSYDLRKARIFIDDHPPIENYFYLINAGICKYSGGGMQMVPHAHPNDGQLALTLAYNLSKWSVVQSLPLLYNGKIDRHPLVSLHYCQKVRIEAIGEKPTLLEADGEFLGETPIEVSIVPDALQIVIP